MRARSSLFVAALLLTAACNAVVNFNPEGQPCDTNAASEAERCLAGYECRDGRCRKAASSPDAGAADAGVSDAGTTDAGMTDAGSEDAGREDAGGP